MSRTLFTALTLSTLLTVAACNAANQGGTRGPIPGQPEPGSPAAQMQQR